MGFGSLKTKMKNYNISIVWKLWYN